MKKSKLSIGISLGIRIAALILLVLFFLPSVNVSCQGYNTSTPVNADISAFDAARGHIDMGDYVECDAAPWLFVIPVLALAIGIIATKLHLVSMLCALANLAMIFIYKSYIHHWVNDNYGEYAPLVQIKTTYVFNLHIIVCCLIVLALAAHMIMLKYRRLSEAKMAAGGDAPSDYPYNAFCPNCGHGLQAGDNFCRHCGRASESPVQPDDVASSDEVATDAEVLETTEVETDHHLEDCQIE